MSIINQLKKTFRPLKNRLYALPLYLQRYANNEVILNGARLKKVKIKIRGSENRYTYTRRKYWKILKLV